MGEILKLEQGEIERAVDRALIAILQGEVIVAAAEHGYLYLCDAFSHRAVEKIHTLRGDAPGTAAMVLVGSANGASGVATDFDESCRKLSEAFWPGLLTLQLAPNPSLPWDLGDGRSLGEFALRSPNREFILALLARSGPLAAASASLAGQGPSLEINAIAANLAEIALFVDEGVLEAGPLSTVLRRAVIGERGLEVLREGAISLSEIRKHLPEVL